MTVAAVVLAGALGAVARFLVDRAMTPAARVLPAGTLAVNVAGSALAGLLAGLVARHGLDDSVRLVAGTGFLAAFTTFSTFAVETVHLAEHQGSRPSALNVAANVVLGVTAAALTYAAVAT